MSLEDLPVIYTAIPLADQPQNEHNDGDTTKSSFKITCLHSFHFIVGGVIGNAHAILGFKRLYGYFQGMSTANVLLYSVIWSLITSLTGYLLYNLAWTIILNRAETNRKLRKFCKPHLLVQYEYATYLGIFLGFCVGCTAADVVYGMPWSCVAATVVMALAWAGLMLACAYRESALQEPEPHKGTKLPFLVVV